jgi:hypothetical protein
VSGNRITAIAVVLLALAACDERGHAPYGSNIGGPIGGTTFTPPDTGGDVDGDTDTDSDPDGGTGGCTTNEVAQPETTRCWMRCPLGQGWADDYCAGSALILDWQGAVAGCAALGGGRHLASRLELTDLLGNCEDAVLALQDGFCDPCDASEACAALFGSDLLTYWTSTDGIYAPWATAFDSGLVFEAETELDLYQARCVRDAD